MSGQSSDIFLGSSAIDYDVLLDSSGIDAWCQLSDYDVFLSSSTSRDAWFFGDQLRKALHDKVIHTFLDNDFRSRGEEIAKHHLKEIEQSRTAIIVLSQNYASSSWCLDELCKILDCNKEKGMWILPVFYGVDPSDVRRQRGPFGEAFERHEKEFKLDKEKVLIWRDALVEVASFSGCVYQNEPEHQIIQHIVKQVSKKLYGVPLLNIGYVVGIEGIESQIQEVLSLLELESDSDGALMMGIYGAAGIGKTTLARVICNRIAEKFEASCYLPDLRQNSRKHGLVNLQNILISQMTGAKDNNLTNIDIGALTIKNRLRRKKVLVILDDVDTPEQLEALAGKPDWFGSGSRVIVTTRDRHLLAFHRVERTYEVQLLNHIDALQLLSHHAFKHDNVDSSYTGILNELVSYASGLPLALKVVGSFLFDKSVEEWKNALQLFKRIPPSAIQNNLKISFDSLTEEEKSVFLDIACCFQGYKLSEAQRILHAHHTYDVKLHINVLIDKSLVRISSDGKVTLHPLIENMGKEIVRKENTKFPGKRSILWYREDIIQVLQNNTGTSSIEMIHLDSPSVKDGEAIEWDGEAFKKMENLRTLIIRNCKFSQAPKYLPKSLRVLEWQRYPLKEFPSDFNPNQLLICKLPHMSFTSLELGEPKDLPSTSSSLILHTSPVVSNVVTSRFTERYFSSSGSQIWILVGLISCVVGLACFALSPSSIRSTGEWTAWKFFIYGAFITGYLIAILFAERSLYFVRNVWNQIKVFPTFIQALQSRISQVLQTSSNVPNALALQDSVRDPTDPPPYPLIDILGKDYKNNIWRVVGLMSSVVGLSCFALSPSFGRLIRGWSTWKFILYEVFSLIVLIAFLSAEQSTRPVGHVWYKIKGFAILMFIAVYTLYYDKAVNGKPEILSLVSNAAFVLMSLCYSKLTKYAHEMGVFSFFLSCLAAQLWIINRMLIFVAICFGFPLFVLHSSSDPIISIPSPGHIPV